MRTVRTVVALFAVALATSCIQSGGSGDGNNNNNNNNKENGNEGGKRVAGSFFGGGSQGAGANDDSNGGSRTGGGEQGEEGGDGEGGREGLGGSTGPSGGGGSVGSGACTEACSQIIGCLVSVCGLELSAAEQRDAANSCAAECAEEASQDEIEEVRALTGEGCAGIRALDEDDGLCDQLDAEDFTDGGGASSGSGGSSGSGTGTVTPVGPSASQAECEAFCGRAVQCCEEEAGDQDDCAEFAPVCMELCAQLPAEGVRCVAENQNQSCDEIEARCERLLETDGDVVIGVDEEDGDADGDDDDEPNHTEPAPPPDDDGE